MFNALRGFSFYPIIICKMRSTSFLKDGGSMFSNATPAFLSDVNSTADGSFRPYLHNA